MIDEKVKKWVIKALEDFNSVEHEFRLSDEEIVTSTVCFHCQQFVEKMLKAYLTLKKIDFGKTHDLEVLLKLCIKEDKDFQNLDIGDLTFYAVEVRYPEEFYTPTLEEAKECFEIASKVKDFVFKKLEIKEKDF
ncbi:MAG TPA: DNA-binding protein [Elusimicrobia bacterium]|jgi:HEPN domain-containing protein|nr:DNA-binding protein [Elusimicrobiota bacterium]